MHKQSIIDAAHSFGFNRVRFVKAETNISLEHYDRFLANGLHGTMDWMVRSRPPRADIRQLLPTIQTVVVLGLDYWHPRPPKPDGLYGKVSCYAWGRDYHKVITKRLKKLGQHLQGLFPELDAYWTVDSRPVIERGWASKSGMGFVGKNTMVIAPAESSYFFLATLLINLEVEPDKPIQQNHCGRCTRCLDKCPTNAFIDAFRLDARRCISYLTIEHDGVIPKELASKMGDWLFGCDVCQDVCPHNHKKWISKHSDLAPRPKHAWVDLDWLFKASNQEILDEFAGTPLRRTGVPKLRRNATVLLMNNPNFEDSASLLRWVNVNSQDGLVQKQLLEGIVK